ncbi:MAG: nitrite reductase [Comamonas sp.]
MADAIKVQGWCPTAWKPMQAQDGWIVRVRPFCASINAGQWATLAALALSHAHSQIELTRLGNVQLRGVSDTALPLLLQHLVVAQLVPADADVDLAPPVHCTPFYSTNGLTHQLCKLLAAAVVEHLRPSVLQGQNMEALPSKFGLLVDDEARSLSGVASDLRVWVHADGGYGLALGDSNSCYHFTSVEQVVDAAIHISMWFARERMVVSGQPPTRLQAVLQLRQPDVPALKATLPQITQAHDAEPIAPGAHAQGWLLGASLGRIDAQAMCRLAKSLPAHTEMRVTPWRSLLLMSEDAQTQIARLDAEYWITHSADARLRVSACTGSPRCTQAHIPAQAMALQLASHIPEYGHLHVSGCAKFCALSSDATSVIAAGIAESGDVLLHVGSAKQLGNPAMQVSYQAWLAAPAELQQHLHDLPI